MIDTTATGAGQTEGLHLRAVGIGVGVGVGVGARCDAHPSANGGSTTVTFAVRPRWAFDATQIDRGADGCARPTAVSDRHDREVIDWEIGLRPGPS